ncbi:MAG: CheR family methyltransferase [Deltaproteobacteria bacterium]
MVKVAEHQGKGLWFGSQAGQSDYSMFNETFIARTRDARMREAGYESVEAYDELLKHNRAEADAFSAALHVGYSTFFRNPLTFNVLEQVVLPRLIREVQAVGRHEIRIWSAGCAAGQESYSIAMLLEELLEKDGLSIEYRICATDACETQIVRAHAGNFAVEALDNVCLRRLNRWFIPNKSGYSVLPKLAERVEFSVFDLLDGRTSSLPASIFGGFDLVLCCNLLFYYTEKCQKLILQRLGNNMNMRGYVVTGEVERGILKEDGYREVYEQAGIFEKMPGI